MSRRLFGFGRRGSEHGAKAARRLGKPRVDVIRQVLVIGMDRVIAQNRQIDPEHAEDSFRIALEIAREQGTRGYELRAATSLARLWREQGRRGEARDLLAPLYGWFTEGFDTADLKDAGKLLSELA